MNTIKTHLAAAIILIFISNLKGQSGLRPVKISHAEPLFYDLVRDLGARKGEKELNAGANFTNTNQFLQEDFLLEYEFAPIHRLGVEIEADFAFYNRKSNGADIPHHKLEFLRFSTQYSFLVSSRHSATLAIGYTQLFEMVAFKHYGKKDFIAGIVYNPFFIAAKRWGKNFHSLLYICPLFNYEFATRSIDLTWQINSSVHYIIPATKHFIGIELNKEINGKNFELTIRPQLKIKVNEKLALGFVTGIPVKTHDENSSYFMRVIYEL